MTEIGRHLHSWQEQMARYHGEIERAVYAAEQHCPTPADLKKKHFQNPYAELSCTLLDVPYECPMRDYNALCTLPKMRRLVRDHIQQDDIPGVPAK